MGFLKILLLIIRIPCTIWYIPVGAICWMVKKAPGPDGFSEWVGGIVSLEFASLTKFYHIKW